MRPALALLLVLTFAACGGDAHDGHTTAPALGPAEPSADPDLRFIDGMMPHHEGALGMARLAADRAASPEVRALAQTIVQEQTAEIDTLRAWRARWFPGAPMAGSGTAMAGMDHTAMDTQALDGASGEALDRLFLTQMIAHHAGAIPMAADAHARTARPEVRALASHIVRDQAREIGQMQTLLDARVPAGAPVETTAGTAPAPDAPPTAAPAPTTDTPAPPAAAPPPVAAPAPRTVAIQVTAGGFEPARFDLPVGVASRLVFTRTSDATCATSVLSPALGLAETALPLGQAVSVEVRPQRAGEFTFACGMDMVTGVIVAR